LAEGLGGAREGERVEGGREGWVRKKERRCARGSVNIDDDRKSTE